MRSILMRFLLLGLLIAPVALAEVAGDKHGLPGVDDIKKSEKTIRELFKDDFAKTDSVDRQVLIAKLLQQADENLDDPAAQYVLIREARDLAVEIGDANCATQVQRKLFGAFKVDFDTLLLELKKVETTAKGAEAVTALAALYANSSDDALAAGDYDSALKFNSKADDLLPQIKDAALKARLKTSIPKAQAFKRESVAGLAAQKTLSAKPDDPAANLAAGRFALILGEQEKAMQMLAKGSDAVLSGLAKRELTLPTEAEKQAELGDGWFELGEKEKGLLKEKLNERAALWYAAALPKLNGLVRLKVEGRLKTLPPPPARPAILVKSDPQGNADTVRLTDLTPKNSFKGHLINKDPNKRKVIVDGKECNQYIFLMGSATVTYEIPAGMRCFSVVGTQPTGDKNVSGKWKYAVYIDGKKVYISEELAKIPAREMPFKVEIPEGAKEIMLETDGGGKLGGMHAVWAYPEFKAK